jgi:uncharacterized cupredoxin-like copper-binding protein
MLKRLAAVVFVALVAAACGARPQAAQTIPIRLTEFAIESPITVFEAGVPYRFVITNAGALDHEFVVSPGEMEGHDHMDEGAHEMSGAMLHVASSELTPGAIVTVEFTFSQPAQMLFGCYLPGHYEAGMFAPVTVGS